MLLVAQLVAAAGGVFILGRGTIYFIRKANGRRRAEVAAIAANVGACLALSMSAALHSVPAFVVGLALLALNFYPRLFVMATGGPDEIDGLRAAIRDLFGSMGSDSFPPPERIDELKAKTAAFDRFQSPLARPVVDAVQRVMALYLSGAPDRAAIHAAHDVLDARIAELRAVRPW